MSVDRIHYLGCFFHPFPLSQKIIQSKNGGEIASKTKLRQGLLSPAIFPTSLARLRSNETISNPSDWQCIEDWQPGTCLNGHVHCKDLPVETEMENMAHVRIGSSVPKWIFLENSRKKIWCQAHWLFAITPSPQKRPTNRLFASKTPRNLEYRNSLERCLANASR